MPYLQETDSQGRKGCRPENESIARNGVANEREECAFATRKQNIERRLGENDGGIGANKSQEQ